MKEIKAVKKLARDLTRAKEELTKQAVSESNGLESLCRAIVEGDPVFCFLEACLAYRPF
jgi:hypothetical protein